MKAFTSTALFETPESHEYEQKLADEDSINENHQHNLQTLVQSDNLKDSDYMNCSELAQLDRLEDLIDLRPSRCSIKYFENKAW